jgi:hypothetical protein
MGADHEDSWRSRAFGLFGRFLQDFAFAIRQIRRNPSFALTAIARTFVPPDTVLSAISEAARHLDVRAVIDG